MGGNFQLGLSSATQTSIGSLEKDRPNQGAQPGPICRALGKRKKKKIVLLLFLIVSVFPQCYDYNFRFGGETLRIASATVCANTVCVCVRLKSGIPTFV